MPSLGSAPTYQAADGRTRDATGVFGQTTTPAFDPATMPNPNGNPTAPRLGRITSPATLPDVPLANGVVIKALTSNTADVELLTGAQTAGQGYPMAPGEIVSLAIASLASVRVVGSGSIAYAAS